MEIYVKDAVRLSTFNSYRTYVRNHFAPVLGKHRLIDITPRMLQEFYNFKRTKGNLSPKTIINMNLCLHKALDQAIKEGLISSNPASALNLKRGTKPQIEVLTRDQQMQLLRESLKHRYGVFIRLTLATGLRIGELTGLKWEDIDFQTSLLHIRRSLNRQTKIAASGDGAKTELVLSETKTGSGTRDIPLLRGALDDLRKWRMVQDHDRKKLGDAASAHPEMVVTNELGQYIEPRTFSDHYHSILEAAKLPHFTFHALRHTFATRALEQGMDEKTLSVILGHASVSFTLDTYTHVLDGQKRQEMQRMEELFTLADEVPTTYPAVLEINSDHVKGILPDFPQVVVIEQSMEICVRELTNKLREEIAISIYPSTPSAVSDIKPDPGQMVLAIQP